MRTLFATLALISLFTTAALAADDQGIKDRVKEFSEAWNKDDTKAMAALWTDDGTLINPVGRFAKGREDIEKIFIDEHEHMFKATKYEASEVTVQWVSDDVAIVDITANISGIVDKDGAAKPDYPHHVVWVFVKKDGKWMAAAARPYQFMGKPAESRKL